MIRRLIIFLFAVGLVAAFGAYSGSAWMSAPLLMGGGFHGSGGGGGGGSNIPCANGQTPFVGSVPAVAAAAGFTTCAYNGDFSNSFYASQSNFVDCDDTHPNLLWHNRNTANACNLFQVTDPDGVDGNVLRIQWLTSYGHATGGNLDARVQEYDTFKHTGNPYLAFPNMYIEISSRLDASSFPNPPVGNCCGPAALFFCQIDSTHTNVGILSTEIDPYELYAGATNPGNIGAQNGAGFGDANSATQGCGGSGPQQWHWFSTTTNNLPSGWNMVTYHRYGMLVTSNGSNDMRTCFFVDDVLQGNQSTTPACGTLNPTSASFLYKWFMTLDYETPTTTSPTVNQTLYYKYARVWTCPSWSIDPAGPTSSFCFGSQLHTGTGGNDPTYWF